MKTILLCDSCARKFNWRRAGYFVERKIHVGGTCDDCRQTGQVRLHVHEKMIGPKGVWTPQ
jgi:hypothetical protein